MPKRKSNRKFNGCNGKKNYISRGIDEMKNEFTTIILVGNRVFKSPLPQDKGDG